MVFGLQPKMPSIKFGKMLDGDSMFYVRKSFNDVAALAITFNIMLFLIAER